MVLARKLAVANPEELNVMDWHSFYDPGWEKDAYDSLFDPKRMNPEISEDFIFQDNYGMCFFSSFFPIAHAFLCGISFVFLIDSASGIHLFESHKNFQLDVLPLLNEHYIRNVDNVFNRLVRKYFR